jgi:peptidoglycan/LPS O-acetylase OafA/YrhL
MSDHERVAEQMPGPIPAPRKTTHYIGLDGARGLAAIGVAIAHVTLHFSPNTQLHWRTNVIGLGLFFFYVLSGFLLFLPYVRRVTNDPATARMPGTKIFAAHRVGRILPTYFVVFLLCNYVFRCAYIENPALQPPGTDDGTGMITDPGQLLANLTLTHSYFPKYFQTGLNPSWSLTLQTAFYVSLPLLGLLVFAMRRRTSFHPLVLAAVAPVILVVLGLVGRLLVPYFAAQALASQPTLLDWGPNWAAVYTRSFVANADNFGFGMLAAVLAVAMEQRVLPETVSRRVGLVSAICVVPALLAFVLAVRAVPQYWTATIAFAMTLMMMVVVAPVARGENSRLARTLDLALFRFVGKVSMSVYLWHFPLMLLMGRLSWMAGDTPLGMLRNIVLLVVVTLLVSTVTYYVVEKPAMDLVHRHRHKLV